MLANQPAKAEAELQKAVQLDPKNGSTLLGLAAVEAAGNRMGEAEETYQRVAALPDPQYKPQHALFLYKEKKREAALAEFEKLARADPNDRSARNRLFAAYAAIGKKQAAQDLVAAALKKNADSDALFERAGISLRSGNAVEAEKDLGEVLSYKPDFAEGHAAMAEVDKAKGLALEERKELTEALRINPSLLQSRLALGRRFTRGQQAKSALDILNSTPANQKDSLAVITERNWALMKAARPKSCDPSSTKSCESGVRLNWLFRMASFGFEHADYSGAISDAEEAIRDNPGDVRGPRLLGDTYLAQKQPAKAKERLKEIVVAHSKSAPLENLLGKWYLSTRNGSAARKAFEAALAADPKSVEASMALAGIDFQEKHPDAARQRLRDLIAANPKTLPYCLCWATWRETWVTRKRPCGAIARQLPSIAPTCLR